MKGPGSGFFGHKKISALVIKDMANCTCDGEHYECMGCDKMICYEMTDGGCGICLHCDRCGDCGCDCETCEDCGASGKCSCNKLVIDENLEELTGNDITMTNIIKWNESIDRFKETLWVHYSYKNDLSDNKQGILQAWGNAGIVVRNSITKNQHKIRILKVHSIRKIRWNTLLRW